MKEKVKRYTVWDFDGMTIGELIDLLSENDMDARIDVKTEITWGNEEETVIEVR